MQFWLDSIASWAWNTVPIFSTWLSSVTQASVPMALLWRLWDVQQLQCWPLAWPLLSASYCTIASWGLWVHIPGVCLGKVSSVFFTSLPPGPIGAAWGAESSELLGGSFLCFCCPLSARVSWCQAAAPCIIKASEKRLDGEVHSCQGGISKIPRLPWVSQTCSLLTYPQSIP